MKDSPKSVQQKRIQPEQSNTLPNALIDFASNDYLGFSKNKAIFEETHRYLIANKCNSNGVNNLYALAENHIAEFHQTESALIFNSAYDATLCFFNSVPQKGDLVLYDELCHASIRDGIQHSTAKSYKFQHNDFEDLEGLIQNRRPKNQDPTAIYIVTESVFSMDGDTPNLEELIQLSGKHKCHLVIDEAHALGVFGQKGEGLVQLLGLQDQIFARILNFNEGLGCPGAAIIGSQELKDSLTNFAQSFTDTKAHSPDSAARILVAYQLLELEKLTIERLRENSIHFNQQKYLLGLKPMFVQSKSAIQSAIIPGNQNLKSIASQLQNKGFDVKAILSPTVPEGQERLRFCLHSFNSKDEISELLRLLVALVF
jgi:8-amino-7-oxononanoate synthase